MLDLRQIRRDPDAARAALARRGGAESLDRLLLLDARRRELLPEVEQLRHRQNQASERIGQAKRAGEDAAAAIEEVRGIAPVLREREAELTTVEEELGAIQAAMPNLPDPSAPLEEEVLREVGPAGREGRDHLELLGDMVDMEAGARLAGSRFAYLKGPVVMLELALVRWAMERVEAKGFTPVIPPVLVREEALFGTGFLPDTEQQIYRVPDDDLYLTGTSEVALAGLHGGEILDAGVLPLRYAAFSSCFRREAGAAGRDTRGIFRVHQFDKVEMFAFVAPEDSPAEHEHLLAIEEELFQALEIPYRVVNIAASDLGSAAAKKYDLEAWLPGQARFREVTSCSNTTGYQARRLNVRYRPSGEAGGQHSGAGEGAGGAPHSGPGAGAGGAPRHVHTLNGTAVAVGRTLIALVENHQQEDGTVRVPAALHPYGAPELIAAG